MIWLAFALFSAAYNMPTAMTFFLLVWLLEAKVAR